MERIMCTHTCCYVVHTQRSVGQTGREKIKKQKYKIQIKKSKNKNQNFNKKQTWPGKSSQVGYI